MALFNPPVTCPTCRGAKKIVMNSFGSGGRKLVARKCPGCNGKGKLKRR
jgi:DnaJ-class molecular chaperone